MAYTNNQINQSTLEMSDVAIDVSKTSLALSEYEVDTEELGAHEKLKEEESVKWITIIFLPFQLWWQLIMIAVVYMKVIVGPLSAAFPFIYCTPDAELDQFTQFIKTCYVFVCDMLYIADTFLYIVHRQVQEEATKREYTAKTASFLLLDIISILPLYQMFSDVTCGAIKLWPRILKFNEVVLIYRIVNFFRLNSSHNYMTLVIGFLLLYSIVINTLTCLLIIWTHHGLCDLCNAHVYDWRGYKIKKLQREKNAMFALYAHALSFLQSLILNKLTESTKPSTYVEIGIANFCLLSGQLFVIFILHPKCFEENVLRLRRIYDFHPRVNRIIQETKLRNPVSSAHISVEKFYRVVWDKRSGITSMPHTLSDLPEYIRLDIQQDLVWAVFYHSPTLRKTTTSYRRWLGQHINLIYKQPGERFFSGDHCYSNMYYLKSGIVQIISADDTTVPMLSVTGGTLFGDISFLVPPLSRRVIVRCLTYCEVFSITRGDILKSLHKFPDNRLCIMQLARDKLKHAYDLFKHKMNLRGQDRSEDEGLSWIKRRWWEISNTVNHWKLSASRKNMQCEIPQEESNHHCSKFIGQLVLCPETNLNRKSMFAKVDFPWIITPQSIVGNVWHNIVRVTVILVLFIFPPNLSRNPADYPLWFIFLSFLVDVIYIGDVCLSIFTATETSEKTEISLPAILAQRCRSVTFILDLLSTPAVDYVVSMFKDRYIITLFKFNRLLKTYIFFSDKYQNVWQLKVDPIVNIYTSISMVQFCFLYISSYFLYTFIKTAPNDLSEKYHIGELCLEGTCNNTSSNLIAPELGILGILAGRAAHILFTFGKPETISDHLMACALTFSYLSLDIYLKMKHIAALYLQNQQMVTYQYFVSNLKEHYTTLKIHPALLRRLERYLNCHWKYYHGINITEPNLFKNEPYEIYLKLHGQKAEKIIGDSKAFTGANPALIKNLALAAKFLILPKFSTMILFGVQIENVVWISRGAVKCEFHDERGQKRTVISLPGEMLAMTSVFFRKIPLRTYTSASDIEMLYIPINEFYRILRRHPNEWDHVQSTTEEMRSAFEDLYATYTKTHKDYQRKLREEVFHASQKSALDNEGKENEIPIPDFLKNYRRDPESLFILIWLPIRMIAVLILIGAVTCQGIAKSQYLHYFPPIIWTCHATTIIDMLLKLFLPYYDDRGVVIFRHYKCILRYLTTSFLIDMTCLVTVNISVTKSLFALTNEITTLQIVSASQSLLMYNVVGFFNYWADSPSSKSVYITIFKWQVITLVVACYLATRLMAECVSHKYGKGRTDTLSYENGTCWLSPMYTVNWWNIFISSWNAAQSMLMNNDLGLMQYGYKPTGYTILMLTAVAFFWYQKNQCQTLIALCYRGETMFKHGVAQLETFLQEERVEKHVIEKSLNHFVYRWRRTAGVNTKLIMNDTISVVFRQDLNYFFFHNTLKAADSMLGGGEWLERQLASNLEEMYFLPGEDIVREMDLTPHLYIVHRGNVAVTTAEGKVVTLGKGSIFGQLEGTTLRPITINAQAETHADVLAITIQDFQESISDEVRENIRNSPNVHTDYMHQKQPVQESPFNTVDYILRGKKVLKIPKIMEEHILAEENKWYQRWLLLVWVVGPLLTAALNVLYVSTRSQVTGTDYFLYCIIALDILHFIHFVTDLFTMELYVDETTTEYVYVKWRKLTMLTFYIDIITLSVPWILRSFVKLSLVRLLRMYTVLLYHNMFCKSLQSKAMSTILKIILMALLILFLVCYWVELACEDDLDAPKAVFFDYPKVRLPFLDKTEWALRHELPQLISGRNISKGCLRTSSAFDINMPSPYGLRSLYVVAFLKPVMMDFNYFVALTYINIILTNTNMNYVMALSFYEIVFKLLATHMLYLAKLWLSSVVISITYAKYREMYHFDYGVTNLLRYLNQNGVTAFLQSTVRTYTNLLWERQKGNWLPDITHQAPLCLREDILSSLYMHHLLTPAIFTHLPMYFLRQLAVRLQRVVIFPGHSIVKEGDICPRIYFIHEGEVEKWHTDANGESQMMSVLTINGYFGLVSGLYPNVAYQYTYTTRTVADLIILEHDKWQDLLDGYPQLKQDLYVAASSMRKDTRKGHSTHSSMMHMPRSKSFSA